VSVLRDYQSEIIDDFDPSQNLEVARAAACNAAGAP
jgi:hypothetical protein